MSVKRTVTSFRSSDGGGGATSGAPQARQNFATSGLSCAHRAQIGMGRVWLRRRTSASDHLLLSYAQSMREKRYLMTPGPTPVPPEVLAALAEPMIHHRGRDFRDTYRRCLERLRDVYRTEHEVLLFTSSGTVAFEYAVANLDSRGDRVLVVSAGNFGERWAAMTRAYGADVVHLRLAWGDTPDADDLRSALADARDVRAVYLVHSETSTGVVADVQSLAAAAKEAGALVVVDAISSLGLVPCETDAWGLDVVVAGSQKALMCPPGLGPAAVSHAALASTGSWLRFYFDWA